MQRRNLGWAIMAVLAVAGPACKCSERVRLQGPPCTTSEDCLESPSCAWRPNACTCEKNVCLFDPNTPLDSEAEGCRSCHGSLANPAPPRSLLGAEATSDLGVGAHQRHLEGGAFSRPVPCRECHGVPERVRDPGHTDSDPPAEVTFGQVAGAPAASWDRVAGRCSNACHGSASNGAQNPSPSWTTVDGSQASCGACHGLPPPAPHPQSQRCENCHPPTAGPNLTVANRLTHVDGVVQVVSGGCDSCHGDPSRPAPLNAAPPRDLNSSFSSSKVGAHLAHLVAAGSVDVACEACHRVPAAYDSPGHVDDSDQTAEVTFGGLAIPAGGGAPSYAPADLGCSNTYCHGVTQRGGNNGNRARWTDGQAAARCDSCHGFPPPLPHAQSDACGNCHKGYARAGVASGTTNKATHVDGIVEVEALSCASCHGDPNRASDQGADPNVQAAPPVDTAGVGATSSLGVGAHLSHVNPGPGGVADPISCTTCHPIPTVFEHADGLVQTSLEGVARAQGSAATWTRSSATCSATWCHGANALLSGGTDTQPVWNSGTTADCQSCHGLPPPVPHPQNDSCHTCHPGYSKTGPAAGTVNRPLHVNGAIDLAPLECSTCHGTAGRVGSDPNAASAPPVGTAGETASTTRAVGAHLVHLTPTSSTGGFACAECHQVPATIPHADGTAAVSFGALARAGGALPSWTGTTCQGSYCHGAFKNGNASNAPGWTSTGQASCGSCHGAAGNARPGGNHPNVLADSCGQCHPGYFGTTVDAALHVNGRVDVINLVCTSCHGDQARPPVIGADPNFAAAPPVDTTGGSSPGSLGVGAHLEHVAPGAGAMARPLPCADCHPVPSSISHSDGAVQVAFSTLAQSQGSAPSWTRASASCSNVWCHGGNPRLTGGSATTVVWNAGTQLNCASCHGNPPPAPHPQSTQCDGCHVGYAWASPTTGTVNPATHVNGSVDTVPLTCTTCHGTSGRVGKDPEAAAAPPTGLLGETATTSRAVGAHLAHLEGGALSSGVLCAECHPVPPSSSMLHANASLEVTFGALAKTGGVAPSWNGSRCASSYCHGNFRNGNGSNAPLWTASGQADCGSCHGTVANAAPGGTHPGVTANSCASCHEGYTGTTVDLTVHMNGRVDVINLTCTSCHGEAARVAVTGADADVAASPPVDTLGSASSTAVGVGAHLAHVNPDPATAFAKPLHCSACHQVPTSISHSDGVVQVSFGSVATAQGSSPTWNRGSATCANAWCHGGNSRLLGGTATTVVWNTNATVDCRSCHGNPPPRPHVQNDDCGSCHVGYAKTGPSTGTVDLATHIDGTIDTVALGCSTCHGTAGRPGSDPDVAAAPPTGTGGETSTFTRAVGAHLAHLQPGLVSPGVPCAECHGVPASSAFLHADGAATVRFGPLGTTGGVVPAWNGVSCSSSYCHGNFRNGAVTNLPIWSAGPGQATCGTCHALPPGGTHPAGAQCENCHAGYTTTTVNMATHVNGLVDVVNLTCQSCHGDAARASVAGADPNQQASPPIDTFGRSLASFLGVGAHLSHVNHGAGAISRPAACADCHPVPGSTSHSDATVQVSFGALARTQASAPTWTRSTATCAGNWCHGGNPAIAGGTRTSIVWNNGTTTDCRSCHGNPPPAPHVQSDLCGNCHSGYSKTGATTGTVNVATHVNGIVETVALTCTTCHGTAGRTGADPHIAAAPPVGTRGEGATTSRAVGAHLAHLQTGTLRAGLPCAECHTVPAATDFLHADANARVTFGTLAKTGGALPSWSGVSCSSSYCHGNFRNGNLANSPTWTGGASQATCGTCHGSPPGGTHPANATCANCHAGYTSTTVNLGQHVNGTIDVVNLTCQSCHGDAARSPVAGADPNQQASPPVDSFGNSATTALGVGAHLAHVNHGAGAVSNPLSCASCHPVPSSTSHSDGTVQVAFGAMASSQGSAPTWNRASATCAGTWCHGANAKLVGGTRTTIAWNTGTTTDCRSCHGNPPPAPHVQNDSCGPCHAGYTKSSPTAGTVNLTTHLNGTIDYAALTCATCHGTSGRTGADPNIAAAPPLGTRGEAASTTRAVGAHLPHLQPGSLSGPFACAECHTVPAAGSQLHADGAATVVFGTLSKTGGVAPAWNGSSCASTYCHGSFRNGNATNTPLWTSGVSQVGCTSCHGSPPGGTHPANPACANCHSGYTASTVNVAQHVNGTIDVVSLTCQSCHGDAARASVAGADANQQASPPVDSLGNTATTALGVGTHLAHVNHGAGAVASPLGCAACHPVPASTSHSDGAVQVLFGSLARSQTSSPTWTRATATCAGSWCHGGNAKLKGGTRTSIVWTDATPTDCRSCHGNPPPPPHVQNDACGSCHTGFTKTGAGTGTVNLAVHVNGTIDYVAMNCATCHGTAGRTGADPNIASAPPVGTRGETAATTRAVGAHLPHLQPGTLSGVFACSECHTVPAAGNQLHADAAAQVTFGTLAKTGAVTPVWNGTTCTSSYCHGNFKNGSLANAPSWTGGVSQVGCTSCHGSPPGGTHPANATCANCHTGYTATTVNLGLHVNGVVNTTLTCASCHGTLAVNDAPPVDTQGRSATTVLGVGAHQGHVRAGTLHGAIPCTECHPSVASQTHSDGVVQMAFGPLANKGTTSVWTRATATCSADYCHGGSAALHGGLQTAPVWTTVNGTQKQCTSCHGNPPPVPHPQNTSCGPCHTGYTNSTVTVATHIDGIIQKPTGCTACHGTAGRTGSDPNIASAPPVGTRGETATTTRAVGAHLAHLNSGALSGPFACVECHVVPAAGNTSHGNGTAAVTFGPIARAGGASPTWNGTTCASSYCHGAFVNGATGNAPGWTAGPAGATCGSCHGSGSDPTPGGTHPAVAPATSCGTCHPGYTRTTVNVSLHVNGIIEGGGEPLTPGTSCGSCHTTQFNGMTGGVAKATKHMLGGGDNPIDPGGTWTGTPTLKAAPLYANASCVNMCHGDHPHDLTSPATATHQNNVYPDANLRSSGRSSSTRVATDFNGLAVTGGLCLSCHRNPVDAAHPGLSVAAFAASAHSYTTNPKGTWTYTLHDGSTFARNCTKCHADRNDGRPNDSTGPIGSVHYSDYPSLLSGSTNPAGNPATFVCNNCHGNATVGVDLSGKDTATEFAKAQGHPVNADNKHNSVTEATLAFNDGKLSGANRHVNCADCHDPHEAGATSHSRTATATSTRSQIGAGSPLLGTSGVNLSSYPAKWTATGSGNYTFVAQATTEPQVCLKCHSAFAFGASPPNGPSGLVETDVAMEFNPNNGSGHPVLTGLNNFAGSVVPKALSATQLGAPWNVNMGTQTMMCSDCHGADVATPAAQGPHASAIPFLLTGVQRTWPGTFTLAGWNTGLGTPAGIFCLNCHPSKTANKAHTTGEHGSSRCTACHIRVPHGGKISRLIATATAGLPARYQQSGVTVTVTQFKKAATPTGYGKSNCNTNCGGHGAVTSPETW